MWVRHRHWIVWPLLCIMWLTCETVFNGAIYFTLTRSLVIHSVVHSNSPKIILIQFDSHPKNWFESIQFGRSTLYCWVMKCVGGRVAYWCLDTFPAFVPAAVASTVQSQSNIAYRLQAVVESRAILVLELILVLVFILFWVNNFYFYIVLVQPKSIVLVII